MIKPKIQFLRKVTITRDDGKPYLIRWNIIVFDKLFGIKLHRIISNDDECMHDHPWGFISVILKGGYYEYTPTNFIKIRNDMVKYKWYRPGSILFRPANWIHRLELKDKKPCWTLVFHSKRFKDWGFFTNKGWIIWHKYSLKEHCI